MDRDQLLRESAEVIESLLALYERTGDHVRNHAGDDCIACQAAQWLRTAGLR